MSHARGANGDDSSTGAATAAVASHAELARLSDHELEQLRRALAYALGQLEVGSHASRLLWRLSRQTRSELGRRRQPARHGPSVG